MSPKDSGEKLSDSKKLLQAFIEDQKPEIEFLRQFEAEHAKRKAQNETMD